MPPESLLSCIMPTRARAHFVRQAYKLWARQSWPERELILIVDLDDPETLIVVNVLGTADPRVHVVRVHVLDRH
jgi:glycosyltransferase involved in cell wall biosynthesis